jgi:hypothetical protein
MSGYWKCKITMEVVSLCGVVCGVCCRALAPFILLNIIRRSSPAFSRKNNGRSKL